MSQGTIVVVEDDTHISDLVDLLLRAEGFRVVQADARGTGLAAIERERPRLAILDVGLPDLDGLDPRRVTRAPMGVDRHPRHPPGRQPPPRRRPGQAAVSPAGGPSQAARPSGPG